MENKMNLIKVYNKKMQRNLEIMIFDGNCNKVPCKDCVFSGIGTKSLESYRCSEIKGFDTSEVTSKECSKMLTEHKKYLDEKFIKVKEAKKEVKEEKKVLYKPTSKDFIKEEKRIFSALQEITEISFRLGFVGVRFFFGSDCLLKTIYVKGEAGKRNKLVNSEDVDYDDYYEVSKAIDLGITIASNLIKDFVKSIDDLNNKCGIGHLEDIIHFKRVLLEGKLLLEVEEFDSTTFPF